jgi:hypothetical protein
VLAVVEVGSVEDDRGERPPGERVVEALDLAVLASGHVLDPHAVDARRVPP